MDQLDLEYLDIASDYGSDVDNDGLLSLQDHHDVDEMLYITSQEAADEFVDDIFATLTAEENAEMKKLYSTRVMSGGARTQIGGPGDVYDTDDIEDIDEHVFKLFELNDTYHDFGMRHRRDFIQNLIMGDKTLPTVLRQDDVADHHAFLDTCSIVEFLVFESGTVAPCPLFNKDYRTEAMVYPPYFENYFEGLKYDYFNHRMRQLKQEFYGVEVWSRASETPKDKVLKLGQICGFCNAVKCLFSTDACFMLDVTEPIVRLLLSYKLVDKRLSKKLLVDRQTQQQAILEHNVNISAMSENKWSFVKCDASLLDCAEHRGLPDDRSTGKVSQEKSRVRVNLYGMPYMGAFEYEALSDVYHDNMRNVEEMNVRKIVADHVWKGTELKEVYSTPVIYGNLETCSETDTHVSRRIAIKRAGDWGQIEHCRKYGFVFVTHDKSAFLYAIMRRTCAMLFIEDSTTAKEIDAVMYSFVMYSPTSSRQKLQSATSIRAPLSEKAAKRQTIEGGGSTQPSLTSMIALSALTGAMAVAGSFKP